MDAQLFSHSATNVGFNPKHPQPPSYIKVRAQAKKERDFDRMFLAQELKFGRVRNASQVSAASNGDDGIGTTAAATPAEKASGLGRVMPQSQSASDAIWALEFSRDGRYLAAAGKDKVVRVWRVLASREDRRMHERDEEQAINRGD
ncbi:MAG: hypothetical protein INR71_08440, partial [Terriglobus roseus]|nr:hypothetical protein [Terriglobus roseus]